MPNQKINKYKISLGGVLDDISDAVSFCIAPAVIFYLVMQRFEFAENSNLPIIYLSFGYTLLGITRLLFFIFDQNKIPGFFKGLPVPGAALFVTAPLIILDSVMDAGKVDQYYWGYVSFCFMVLASILMNSYFIKYIHFGRLMSRNKFFLWLTIILILGFIFTPYFEYVAIIYSFIYIVSPIYTNQIITKIKSIESN